MERCWNSLQRYFGTLRLRLKRRHCWSETPLGERRGTKPHTWCAEISNISHGFVKEIWSKCSVIRVHFMMCPCVLPWQSCSIVPMWRCVWPFRATYMDQLVSVELKTSSTDTVISCILQFGEFSRTDALLSQKIPFILCRFFGLCPAPVCIIANAIDRWHKIFVQHWQTNIYRRMSGILFSCPPSPRYASSETLSLSCSHLYPRESI